MTDRRPTAAPYFLLAALCAPFMLAALHLGGWISGLAVWVLSAAAIVGLSRIAGRL